MPREIKDIGQFDRKITIESITGGRSASGGQVKTWTTVATPWAMVDDLNNRVDGNEKYEAGRETAIGKTKFTIRYRTGLDAKMRILYEGAYYNIRAFNELGRRQFLEIMADTRDNGD
ncbi:MAG: phage head closure protein [Cytophagaceae bacterium]